MTKIRLFQALALITGIVMGSGCVLSDLGGNTGLLAAVAALLALNSGVVTT